MPMNRTSQAGFNEKLSKGEQGSFWFDYDIRFKTWLHTDHSPQITVHRSLKMVQAQGFGYCAYVGLVIVGKESANLKMTTHHSQL